MERSTHRAFFTFRKTPAIKAAMTREVASYREFAPRPELRSSVYAFFSFVPPDRAAADRLLLRETVFREGESFCSPMFADGNVSIVLNLGNVCSIHGQWLTDPLGPHAKIIGPMTTVGVQSDAARPEMLGVYFRPGGAFAFTHAPLSEIKDQVVDLQDLWGASASRLPFELSEMSEAARIARVERELLRRLKAPRDRSDAVNTAGVAACAVRNSGRSSIVRLAESAGVSRQHLARLFRERIGVAPKTFCQLARFQSGLVYAGRDDVVWADAAVAMGYADQSHMIREFRRFSSLTPEQLASRTWFHPFIERARTRRATVAPPRG
jgi:AraC-like DNA-binding protein